MAVSRLRRWWGSRRLLPFAAGLTLLAMTSGAGSGIAAAAPAGPFGDAMVIPVSAPAPHAIRGIPLTDHGVASRSAEANGSEAGTAATGDVAAYVVLVEPLAAGASPQCTTASDDALPLLGVAGVPCGPRAPPPHLV